MQMKRRYFLASLCKAAACIVAATSFPRLAFSGWNERAFQAETLDGAFKNKYPGLDIVDSQAIKLKAPAIAENGSVVPVTVKTDLPDVKSISLFVEKNPSPLAATFNLGPLNVADVSIRIRMGETSNLVAVVESGGKLHRVQQEVKVTIGGCGG
ncbi:thiosulfate oxidation carrier protein SoxY [Gammaproteobacteria bacterium 53_120_T64]|nr:thiosulfate oxidation carrier protein SoxY [Gammaproteobacteria bacterium 53_120_T64]